MIERYIRKMMRGVLIGAVLTTTLSYGQAAGKGTTETPPAQPQTAQPQAGGKTEEIQDEKNFQLSFVARELDENGKVLNSRRFDTMATASPSKTGESSNIRSGAKIPIPTSPNSAQFTYMDVGANFDVHLPRIVKVNRLAMQVSAEISSFDPTTTTEGRPTIRQNRWTGNVEVPIGGHKVIFSSDDLSSKRTVQIELTVTPVAER